jgi:hypothetical protein
MIEIADADVSAALALLAALGAEAVVVGVLLLVYFLAPRVRASARRPQPDVEALGSRVRREL